MERKIIFLDIDGTLVQHSKKVSKKVVDAIRKARNLGHYVMICTGRPRCGVKNLEYIGFDGYICSAGAYIEVDNKVIYNKVLDKDMVKKAEECFQRNHIYYNLETLDIVYQDKKMDELFMYGKGQVINSEMERLIHSSRDEFNIHDLSEYDESIGVYKLSFIALNKEDLIEPRTVLSKDFQFIIHDSFHLSIYNGEIILKEFDKGKAVLKVSQYLDIPIEDTIAFGDSMNDLEMIKMSHYGVVMGNGNDELKQYASHICESVEDDGIYYEFKRLSLI